VSGEQSPVVHIQEAIEALTRFASHGCSGMACDRVRVAWMANQLEVIGRQAGMVPPETRMLFVDIPWERLRTRSAVRTDGNMTADEMQRIAEKELPAVGRQLKAGLSAEGRDRSLSTDE